MGASVDRSDLGLWAIIEVSRWLANMHRKMKESLKPVETKRADHITHRDTPFHHEAWIIQSCCESREEKVGPGDTPLTQNHNERGCHVR
jgi:hypothetical protein